MVSAAKAVVAIRLAAMASMTSRNLNFMVLAPLRILLPKPCREKKNGAINHARKSERNDARQRQRDRLVGGVLPVVHGFRHGSRQRFAPDRGRSEPGPAAGFLPAQSTH